jgi:hypothetical protein
MNEISDKYGYLEWVMIAILTIYLFKYYVNVKNIYNYWFLLLITIIPICLILSIVRAFIINSKTNFMNFREFTLIFAFVLPTVVFISVITLFIQYRNLKSKKK